MIIDVAAIAHLGGVEKNPDIAHAIRILTINSLILSGDELARRVSVNLDQQRFDYETLDLAAADPNRAWYEGYFDIHEAVTKAVSGIVGRPKSSSQE